MPPVPEFCKLHAQHLLSPSDREITVCVVPAIGCLPSVQPLQCHRAVFASLSPTIWEGGCRGRHGSARDRNTKSKGKHAWCDRSPSEHGSTRGSSRGLASQACSSAWALHVLSVRPRRLTFSLDLSRWVEARSIDAARSRCGLFGPCLISQVPGDRSRRSHACESSTWAPQRWGARRQKKHVVAERFLKDTVFLLFIANFSSPTGTLEISSKKIDSFLNHGGTDRQEYVE